MPSTRPDPASSGPAIASARPSPGAGLAGAVDRDRRIAVETPEHVSIAFDLAGAGSRAMAAMIDYLIVAAILVTLGVIAAILPELNSAVAGLGLAVWTFLLFAMQSGYFFLFEWLGRGRTPGKRIIGLRVVRIDGTPITVESAALRNVLRVVDLQPGFTAMLGLGMIAGLPRSQRIGDLVAGTIVVRDLVGEAVPESVAVGSLQGRAVLNAEQFALLDRYVERRPSLSDVARRRLASRVAESLGHPRGVDWDLSRRALDDILTELHAREHAHQAGGLNRQSIHLFATRKEAWREFDDLLASARRRGLGALDGEQVERFTRLYRELTADLARARTYDASLRLQLELDRRVSAGHNVFYRDRRDARVRQWVGVALPREIRRRWRYVVASAALLFVPALAVYAIVRADPAVGPEWAGPVMTERAERGVEQLAEGGSYIKIPATTMPVFGAQITTNNLRVAMTTVAGGALAGVGTAAVLVLNGFHLGSAFGVFDNAGAGPILWEWVLPHGVIELTAIVLAGAAGLLLGGALVVPGRMTRVDALRTRGPTVAGLLGGSLFLLLIAGLIEGYVSPSELPTAVKLGFSGIVAGILFLYLATAGRTGPGVPDPGSE